MRIICVINDEINYVCMLHYLLHIVFVDWDESHYQLRQLYIDQLCRMFLLSAAEGGGAPGREGIQDGRPRRLPARGVRPDEAVLDPGLGGAAFLPYVEGEAAAYQSQGAVPVKRRLTEEGEGEEGRGGGRDTAQHGCKVGGGGGGGGGGEGPQHLPPSCPACCLWDCHTSPPPPTSDVHQPPSASIQGLFSCLCCKAFARQFPLLSTGRCSFLLLNLPLLTFSLSLSLSRSKFFFHLNDPLFSFSYYFSLPSSSPEHGIN